MATQTAPAAAAAPTEDPQAWLTRIDKLLKAESNKEALEEWTKFRRMYPNYPVAKELENRLDTLKK
jgi:hypothetical protein